MYFATVYTCTVMYLPDPYIHGYSHVFMSGPSALPEPLDFAGAELSSWDGKPSESLWYALAIFWENRNFFVGGTVMFYYLLIIQHN